jgi:hypothetical protein
MPHDEANIAGRQSYEQARGSVNTTPVYGWIINPKKPSARDGNAPDGGSLEPGCHVKSVSDAIEDGSCEEGATRARV